MFKILFIHTQKKLLLKINAHPSPTDKVYNAVEDISQVL